MKHLIAKITLAVGFLLAVFPALGAGKITFEASSPLTVALGEPVRVEFALNANPDEGTFKAPSFEGFDVIAGPAESRGQSVQILNGSMTQSINYTITYVLLPQNAGNVTIGAAEIAVDGTVYRTEPLPIEVVNEGDGGQRRQQPGTASGGDGRESDMQSRIGADDILLRAVVSQSSVYKNEPLHVAFKLYTRVPYVNIVPESMPSFNGFWAQEIEQDAQPQRERYNGKVYETRVLFDYLLYPQQVGQLAIDPIEMTVVAQVVVQNRNRDPFFGGGHDIYNVPRKVKSQRATIEVKPLPAGAPSSFNGAVGSFTMETDFPTEHFAANSGATCTVRIAGTGNLTFVQAPKLSLPSSFEQYNVKTTESINPSVSGISGYRQFEYPFIARAEGTYELEPVEFTYFDLRRRQYVTLQSKPVTLEVTPDANGGSGAPPSQSVDSSEFHVWVPISEIIPTRDGYTFMGWANSRTGKPIYGGNGGYTSCLVVHGYDMSTTIYAIWEVHNHSWGEWTSNGNGTHTRTCIADSSHTETGNCSGGKATSTEKAVCETCHKAYGELLQPAKTVITTPPTLRLPALSLIHISEPTRP